MKQRFNEVPPLVMRNENIEFAACASLLDVLARDEDEMTLIMCLSIAEATALRDWLTKALA